MDRIIIIDAPRGGLSAPAAGLKRMGIALERYAGALPDSIGQAGPVIGALVHYKRLRELPALRSAPGLAHAPVIVWYPEKAGARELAAWTRSGAADLVIGRVTARELAAKFKARARSARPREPWLQAGVKSLVRISRALSAREDDFTALLTAARELERLLKGVHCSIITVSRKTKTGMVITQGSRSEPLNIPLDLKKYPEIRKVLDTKKPVAIKNVRRHPLMKEVRDLIAAKDLFSILAVPILHRDEVIGMIILRSAGQERTFSRTEVLFCEMVARGAAAAIGNLRLGREVVQEVRRARQLKRIAKKKTSDLARMEAMFDLASDGIVVADQGGRVRGVNVNFTRLSGHESDAVAGRDVDEIISPAPGETYSVKRAIADHDLEIKRYTQQLHCRDGSLRTVAVRLEHLSQRKEWLISLHDLTDELLLEEALRRTKEFLENVINSSMDAIIAADMKGSIILFNHAAELISGYKAQDVVGKMNIVDIYSPGSARDVMRKLRSNDYGGRGKLEACYNTIIGKDGQELPINMSAAIIYEDGKEVASVGIFQDLRERIRIEKELREAQENLMESRQRQALTAFSGAAAHELNQPLTSIMGYAELLRRVERNLAEQFPEHPAIASLKNATEVIGQEAERMAATVRKIGEVSEYETREYVGSTVIMDLDRSRGTVSDEHLPVWRAMFQNMKEALIVFDLDTVISLANPATVALVGENPIGRSFTRYFKGIEYSKVMEAFETLKKGAAVDLEIEADFSNGQKPLLRIIGSPVPEREEFIAFISDITEFRKAESAVRDLSAFQGQLMKNSNLPLVALDVDGKITFWNIAAEKLLGYSLDEVRGRVPDFLFNKFDPDEYFEHVRKLRREGDLTGEQRLKRKSGEMVRAYHVDAAIRDEAGHALGFLIMLFDLSEKQAFEKELREKTEQITMIGEIMDAIRGRVGLEQEVGEVLKRLANFIPLDLCAVTIADETSRDLLVISYTPQNDQLRKTSLRLYEDAETVRKLLFLDRPVVIADVGMLQAKLFSGDIARGLDLLKDRELHSVITYPLKFGNDVLGTLHIVSAEVGRYTDSDLDRLAQVAGPITLALANARLFSQIERQNLELSRRTAWMEQLIRAGQGISMEMNAQEVLQRLAEPYLDAHPWQHLTAWLGAPDGKDLKLMKVHNYEGIERGMSLELDPEIIAPLRHAARTLELDPSLPNAKYRPLLPESRTVLMAPIAAPDRWLGVVILESHHEKAFHEDEKVELQILAAHIAGALRNLHFYHDLDLALRFQQGLIQDANALILILDHNGRIALVNRALQEALGVTSEEVLKLHYRELFDRYLRVQTDEGGEIRPKDQKFNGLIKGVIKGERFVNLRATILSAKGQEVKAVFNTSSVLDRDGVFQGFIAIGQNITRYRELESHLLQAEKLATVGQMAAGVAHELNNPITGIINFGAMLGRREDLDENARLLVQQLNEEASRIQTLVQNLMSYARPSREEMFPLDLRRLALDSLTFSKYELSRGQVTVETRIPENLKPIRGIKDQLQQVFINLLTNASHACAEKGGGRVVMDAAPINDHFIELRIQDDGGGISAENLDRIFDPFFTTKPEGKGTGLGLTVVREIVARHEGTIRLESVPGQGTTFFVTLPVFPVN
ncbi:MAG TPA: PAS domain S-box protein [bacterium]|nr:PAS domain S-box protein [bacterium]